MKRAALAAVLVLAACTTSDNLGNHVFGDARWSVAVGGAGEERATAIAVDGVGNVIVAGTCSRSTDLLHHARACDGAFITQRATDTGLEQWRATLHNAEISSVGIDATGTIVATGSYHGAADIAGASITTDGIDEFFATFDRTGALLALHGLGVQGIAVAPRGTVAGDGCVFVTGGFEGLMPTPGGWMLDSQFGVDGYLSAHYPDASQSWDLSFAGMGDQLGTGIAITRDNQLATLVRSDASFSGEVGVSQRLVATTYLALYTASGKPVWSEPLAIDGLDHLATAPTGELLVGGAGLAALDKTGRTRWYLLPDRTATIDALATMPDGTIVTASALALRAFTHDGDLAGERPPPPSPGPADAHIDALAVEPTGEISFIATVDRPVDFGNGVLPIAGAHDVVVVKLDSPTGTDWSGDLTRQ